MPRSFHLATSIFMAGCLFLAAGCGGPPLVKVTGQVIKDKQPLAVGKQGSWQINFFNYPEVRENKPFHSYSALTANDGSFEIAAIPPGQYLIAIQQLDPMPANDLLEGAFTRDRSKIVREVTGKEPLVIDLAQPEMK